MAWNSIKLAGTRTYKFTYDALNRLKTAVYTGKTGENYNTSYSYDNNGNITKLNRFGYTVGTTHANIDNLTYTYNGNQLIGVNDVNSPTNQVYGFKDNNTFNVATSGNINTHEYRYDKNGNLIKDFNKQIDTLQYNYLNLPVWVDLGENNFIEYLYDAAGIKLRQKVYNSGNLQKTNGLHRKLCIRE